MKENPKEQSMSEFDKYKKPTGCSYTFQPDGIDYCWGYAASVDSGAKMDCTGCEYLLPEPPKEIGSNSLPCSKCGGQHHPAECLGGKQRKYKSVDDMVWKMSGWKFKLKWFWDKLWRKQ